MATGKCCKYVESEAGRGNGRSVPEVLCTDRQVRRSVPGAFCTNGRELGDSNPVDSCHPVQGKRSMAVSALFVFSSGFDF